MPIYRCVVLALLCCNSLCANEKCTKREMIVYHCTQRRAGLAPADAPMILHIRLTQPSMYPTCSAGDSQSPTLGAALYGRCCDKRSFSCVKISIFLFVHIGFAQLLDKLEFVRMRAAQYLPPGGRGTAKRWMRNGDTFPFVMQSTETAQPFPMYLFNELHINSKHIAVPHQS